MYGEYSSLMVNKMETPLIIDKNDPKWNLLSKVLRIFDSRIVKLVMSRSGLKPLKQAGIYTKIVLISMYFSLDISYVVQELNSSLTFKVIN